MSREMTTVRDPRSVRVSFRDPREVRPVRVGLLGYGRIGQAVARTLAHDAVRRRLASVGLELRAGTALVRDVASPRPADDGVSLCDRVETVLDARPDVVVEAMGGVEPARAFVERALRRGVPVVSANKSLVAAHGGELRALAAAHRTSFLHDAAALAGVPCLGWLARRPLISGARHIVGIVNGTSHVITSAIGRGRSFDDALAFAVERGFAEPDGRADIDGRDAAEKLAILLQLAGRSDARPEGFARTSLTVLDREWLAAAADLGGVIKPVVTATLEGDSGAWVGPAFMPSAHALAGLDGVVNAIRLTVGADHTISFAGPGAGPAATALTIVDDIVEAVQTRSVSRPTHPARGGRFTRPLPRLDRPAPSRWFGVFSSRAAGDPPTPSATLASAGVPLALAVRRQKRLFALTRHAPWPSVLEATEQLHTQGIDAVFLPALDGP